MAGGHIKSTAETRKFGKSASLSRMQAQTTRGRLSSASVLIDIARPEVRRSHGRQRVGFRACTCPRSGERGYDRNVALWSACGLSTMHRDSNPQLRRLDRDESGRSQQACRLFYELQEATQHGSRNKSAVRTLLAASNVDDWQQYPSYKSRCSSCAGESASTGFSTVCSPGIVIEVIFNRVCF